MSAQMGQRTAEPRRRPVRHPGAGRAGGTVRRVNPEASTLVSVYRKAVPEHLRRAIATRSTPELRRRIKQQVSWLATARHLEGLRTRGVALAHRALAAGPGRAVTMVAGHPRIALVQHDLSPARARRDNLVTVTETLERAGVDHFCVRGKERGRGVVAVATEDGSRALAALAARCRELPGYVSLLTPGREVRHTVPGYDSGGWQRAGRAGLFRVTWFRTDPGRSLVLDEDYGCDVEFWPREEDRLVAPRRNAVTEWVPAQGPRVRVPAALFTCPNGSGDRRSEQVATYRDFTVPLPGDITFPVDVVYTWVDGADPAWLERRAAFTGQAYHDEAANAARYANRDELRYSLRSLDMYAPWVRDVYLVTDDQVPAWLNTAHPRVKVVSHRAIFTDTGNLPTFNSHAIESQLHHIDGLSEHFLYFNDDVFLGREASPHDYFLANGLTKYFPSPALVPLGPPGDDDVPVSVAGKNNRALIEARFGTTPVQKMKHVPHALRRSVLAEMEREFGAQHRATASHRFRSIDDISIPSSLHHYYAFHTGRALPADIAYSYLDLSRPNAADRLDRLLARRDRDVFCLNDTQSEETDLADQLALLRPFLEAYFPLPSPYELPEPE
nr:stealth family protein [Streptomyces niger]